MYVRYTQTDRMIKAHFKMIFYYNFFFFIIIIYKLVCSRAEILEIILSEVALRGSMYSRRDVVIHSCPFAHNKYKTDTRHQ